MKKTLILPTALLSAVMIFGIGTSVSYFNSSSNNDNKTSHSTEVLKEANQPTESKISKPSKAFEATPASVTWPLIANITDKSLEGNLESTISYPAASVAYQVNTKIDFTGDATTDSNVIFWQLVGAANSWTATGSTTVFNPDVYVQLDVNPTNGGTLTVNKIDALVGASGTGNMYYQAFYSVNSDFSNPVSIQSAFKLPNNASSALSFTLSTPVVLSGSQKLYVRFYPYLVAAATNKQFGLRNVKISGTMEGAVANPATVSTTAVSSVSTTSAMSGGTISSNGGGAITASGVVWSTNQLPTIDDSKTAENATTGSYVSSLTGLNPATTYYARAYATNSAGTSYGSQVSFTTLASIVAPTVATTSQSQVTNISFVVSGNVSDWGGANVTERGIVWSKTNNTPTLENDTKVSTGSGLGTFSSYVYGVMPSTLYYARTFATNSAGTYYGSVATVTTKATDPDVIKTISKNGKAAGDYSTVQEAFNAVPDNYTGRWILHILPGTYTERPTLAATKSNVYLIGDDAANTIITNNVSAGTINPDTNQAYGTSLSQTMAIFGNDFTASKITIENSYKNSAANTAINPSTQAVALKTQGDRQAFYDCRILGYQDTYLGNSIGRAYFKNSYIEGNVDFIFGRQTVVFDQCTTYINRNNSVVVAPSTEASTKFGFVFLDCNLTVPDAGTADFNGTVISNFHFGRPWQNRPKAAFIRSVTPAMLNPVGWTTMNAGLNPTFVEYGGTGAGATPDKLALRGNEGVVINATQAQVYTVENVFKKETDPSFVFDWMPPASVSFDFGTLAVDNIKNAKLSVYPNPFTDQVTIAYDLKSASDVNVTIYDMNGRVVKSVTKANQKSGINNLTIQTKDLKTGIYIYSLKSTAGQISGKLIKN